MATKVTARPYENTAIAIYLRKQIDTLASIGILARDIAVDAGYDKPNIISMFKRGETKVPLDKVSALAKALRVDPSFLFRLAAAQPGSPLSPGEIDKIFPRTVTANEYELVERLREKTGNTDPKFTEDQLDRMADIATASHLRSGVTAIPNHG